MVSTSPPLAPCTSLMPKSKCTQLLAVRFPPFFTRELHSFSSALARKWFSLIFFFFWLVACPNIVMTSLEKPGRPHYFIYFHSIF